MERIHGIKTIKRRKYTIQRDYTECKEILAEDFQQMCGYCGKDRKTLLKQFQIDHFAPKSKFPEKKNVYENLVLACPQCNRLKSDKWIGEKSEVSNDGEKGFVDPATEEYDKHLFREDSGKIMYKTEVGKYMYNLLKFNIRRTDLIWKIIKLNELKEELKKSLKNSPDDEGNKKFVEIQNQLDELLNYITYNEKE